MGVAGSPEVLAEVVLGVGGICYEQREDARPPISTVGTMIRTMPATKRDCGLMPLLSSSLRVQQRKRFHALQCSRGLRRCALAWGLLLLDYKLPYVQPAHI